MGATPLIEGAGAVCSVDHLWLSLVASGSCRTAFLVCWIGKSRGLSMMGMEARQWGGEGTVLHAPLRKVRAGSRVPP